MRARVVWPPQARFAALSGMWLLTLPLLVFALLRLTGVADRSPWLFALETLTVWLLLPAYIVLAAAALLRARVLAAAAAVLVAVHVAWTFPDVRWWPTERPQARGRPFVVAAANVAATNTRAGDATTALGDLDADILVVVEYTPELQEALRERGALADYPHRVEDARRDFFGSAVYSRFPISGHHIERTDGLPMLQVVVDVHDTTVTVVAVHTIQPLAGLDTLRRQLSALARLGRSTAGPLVLAGDFNATRQHRPFRALLRAGLRDAHAVRGRGAARTWPVGRWLPPFALLDHVVVSSQLSVLDVDEAGIPGSDHRAVVTRLASRNTAATP